MYKQFEVISHKGPYSVISEERPFENLSSLDLSKTHFIIDETVANLYNKELGHAFSGNQPLIIPANEQNKSFENMPKYISHLVGNRIRKNHVLVAIGGGIIQDITCFLASNLLRGVDWIFWPTTLLAQADSCVGSKSSINCAGTKNILGGFYPPKKIFSSVAVLKTLEKQDLLSGIGEMIKVHIIDGSESFQKIERAYEGIVSGTFLEDFIFQSLAIKRKLIEEDEFDLGIRRVLNYGHSFGHAIESATNYLVPHGIGVTMGMEVANFVSYKLGLTDEKNYTRMSPLLRKNFASMEGVTVPFDAFQSALLQDKKNSNDKLGLILLDSNSIPRVTFVPPSDEFKSITRAALEGFAKVV